ncbi:hypothetical protein [Lysobacter niastensis]|uniref:Lipoprotein n=1 Tax=Lysobacter niastensis TaxID=380629 RepID=A0ABS0B614_9GAMM|nr:hypothetical protein [Lysobacter niastensis]MBF6023658.1 hypothetical protein [Lysobacter niastensis]
MRTRLMQRYQVAFALAVSLALSGGCASTQANERAASQVLTLRGGEQAAAGDGTVRYVRLLSDSRCPVDVQCVWAGDVEVLFEFAPRGETAKALTLTLLRPSSPLGARWIHLIEVERGPSPKVTIRIDDAPAQP